MAAVRWNRKRLWRFAATKWKVVLLLCCVATLLFVLMGTTFPHGSSPPSVVIGVPVTHCRGADVVDPPWTPLYTERSLPKLSDLVVHRQNKSGGVTKVIFLALADAINNGVCHNIASAYLSGVPVGIIAYDVEEFHYFQKAFYALRAAEDAGLDENDVVFYMDSDIMFTGMDPFDLIDRFINMSPESMDKLSPGAVRNGTAMAPFYVSTEELCSGWHTLGHGDACKIMWRAVKGMYRAFAANHSVSEATYADRFNETNYPTQYVNSGAVLTRVWALRMIDKLLQTAWKSDRQSVGLLVPFSHPAVGEQAFIHLLYYDLLLFEINSRVTETDEKITSQFGLPGGMIDADYFQEMSVLTGVSQHLVEINVRTWTDKLNKHVRKLEDDLWKMMGPKTKSKVPFSSCPEQQEAVKFARSAISVVGLPLRERNISVGGVELKTLLVPPMYSNVWRPHVGHVYPMLRHYSADHKEQRMGTDAPVMAWGLPILLNRDARRNAYNLLRSVKIFTHTPLGVNDSSVRTHNYVDVCPFIFDSWGLYGMS